MSLESLLIEHGLLTGEQVQSLRAERPATRIDRGAIDAGLLDESQWIDILARELHLPRVDVADAKIDPNLLSRFSTKAIFHHEVLPLYRENGHVVAAVADPFATDALDELAAASGLALSPAIAPRKEILGRIKESLGVGGDTIGELVRLQEEDDEDDDYLQSLASMETAELGDAQAPSVIRLVNELLVEAVEQRASDVHIEPAEAGLTIRFRVDGVLRVQPTPPELRQFAAAIVTRLKIMARLNIAEKRLPQDGRINMRVAGREIDVRASIIPMVHGEGIVLRLLDKSRMQFDLASVGMPRHLSRTFHELISLPHGIVLVTGPTGSGKSTTLYSALNEIKSPAVKIITVEDPVEYHTPGISQIQVHHKVGLSFAAGLRSILRHDPDVILIGEIRDGETAESAIQASLTGHLVFSTLHTNDAPGAITRLIDMGVEPYLVASTVEGVLAQRLVRRLCPHCKAAVRPEELPADFEPLGATLFGPVGCRQCRQTGYVGRVGIFELMRITPEIRHLASEGEATLQLRSQAVADGMQTLRESGYDAVRAGTTSLDEVIRVTKGD